MFEWGKFESKFDLQNAVWFVERRVVAKRRALAKRTARLRARRGRELEFDRRLLGNGQHTQHKRSALARRQHRRTPLDKPLAVAQRCDVKSAANRRRVERNGRHSSATHNALHVQRTHSNKRCASIGHTQFEHARNRQNIQRQVR